MNKIKQVEIMAVGKWNDTKITNQHLNEMANNFSRMSGIVDVPLKFGHNEEQPMTDGQPALGWVDKVWVEGNKLMASMKDIPDIVFSAINKKLYKNVSVELFFEVEHKGVQYGTVLTAVALLGADMPAVNTLSDLGTYMTANNLAFADHASFSKKPSTTDEDPEMGMTAEEKAQMDKLTQQVSKFTTDMADLSLKNTKLESDNKKLQEKNDELESQKKAAAFAADKKSVESELEQLAKENKITPAQRDKLAKDITAENIGNVKFTISTLKENATGGKPSGGTARSEGDDDKDGKTPDQVVSEKAHAYAAQNKVAFSVAVSHVLASDEKLAREYADFNDQEVV